MIVFYREDNGDYLATDTSSNGHYRRHLGKDRLEARATAITGLVTSLCTCAVSREFLCERCKRIARSEVPAHWLKAIGL